MILSHEHRFIFLKTRKTAGTSIEIALSAFCGPRDIITPIQPEDEALRAALGYRGPQNFERSAVDRARGARSLERFYNHIPAWRAKLAIGAATWDAYYTFSIERDPWERAISRHHYRERDDRPGSTLVDSLRLLEAEAAANGGRNSLSNWPIYTMDDRVAVDRVLRYERLDEELTTLADRIGLPAPLELPWAKASYRADRRPHWEIMGSEERDIVARLCAREIEHFGYRFGPSS